jgi:mannitol-1-phosphate 5-dehydrogenase
MPELIEKLQNTKSYVVTEIGDGGEKETTITNYRAINSRSHEADVVKEIANAEVVSSAD